MAPTPIPPVRPSEASPDQSICSAFCRLPGGFHLLKHNLDRPRIMPAWIEMRTAEDFFL